MNWRAIKAITRKDLKIVFKSRGLCIPLIIVPLVFLVVLPAVASLGPALQSIPGTPFAGLDKFLERMPPGLRAEMAGYDETQKIVVLALVYFLAPFYLLLPLMFATIIAADSFAGEKERKTLEALLYTPTTDQELFLAKLLSAWLPALGIAWGGFIVYSLVANLAAWPTIGRIFFPTPMWFALALWVAPSVAGLGLSVTVLISARAQSPQEAYQLGSSIVVPFLLLVVGQATGVMYLNSGLVLLLGLALWSIDGVLLRLGGRIFQRNEIAARL